MLTNIFHFYHVSLTKFRWIFKCPYVRADMVSTYYVQSGAEISGRTMVYHNQAGPG